MQATLENKSAEYEIGATNWEPKAYRCHLAVVKDEDGGFSAIVLNLPGAGSCGDSEEEAITNVREAVVGVIESYRADGQDIPWADENDYRDEIPTGAKLKWILVHA